MHKTAVIAAILSLGFASVSAAGEVAGTVYDQRGMPVSGVLLSIDGQQAVTAGDGSYRFADVAAGEQLITASGQRVSVSVTEEGEATRNIFLLSRRARSEVTGTYIDVESAEQYFAEALELADEMLSSDLATSETAWRWNDLEA